MVSYADQNEASPSLGAANCKTAASFFGSWEPERSCACGGANGVTYYTDKDEASAPLGAATCETVAMFVGFWGAQRRGILR